VTVESVSQAIAELDDDEKRICRVLTPEGYQEKLLISESGLYSLVLISPIPEAKLFRRWLTHDVLPEIRKTGRYELGSEQHGVFDAIQRMFDAMRSQESQIHEREDSQV
jgi:anti-repressor protein